MLKRGHLLFRTQWTVPSVTWGHHHHASPWRSGDEMSFSAGEAMLVNSKHVNLHRCWLLDGQWRTKLKLVWRLQVANIGLHSFHGSIKRKYRSLKKYLCSWWTSHALQMTQWQADWVRKEPAHILLLSLSTSFPFHLSTACPPLPLRLSISSAPQIISSKYNEFMKPTVKLDKACFSNLSSST